MTEDDGYVLGRSSAEYQRLRAQARLWEGAARQILERAALRPGMSCLDIGCGPGEVMRLMGEMVGTTGHVLGIDIDGTIGRTALAELSKTGVSNFAFLELDVAAGPALPGAPFDLSYARFVLTHLTDPLALLRKMAAATKPGGVIAVQDYNMGGFDIQPRPATWPVLQRVVLGTFERSGKDPRIGNKLPHCFVAAGLGAPDGTDVAGVTGLLRDHGARVVAGFRSLLPAALKLGLATEAEGRACIEELGRLIADGPDRTYSSFLLVSAWKRKPA